MGIKVSKAEMKRLNITGVVSMSSGRLTLSTKHGTAP